MPWAGGEMLFPVRRHKPEKREDPGIRLSNGQAPCRQKGTSLDSYSHRGVPCHHQHQQQHRGPGLTAWKTVLTPGKKSMVWPDSVSETGISPFPVNLPFPLTQSILTG